MPLPRLYRSYSAQSMPTYQNLLVSSPKPGVGLSMQGLLLHAHRVSLVELTWQCLLSHSQSSESYECAFLCSIRGSE